MQNEMLLTSAFLALIRDWRTTFPMCCLLTLLTTTKGFCTVGRTNHSPVTSQTVCSGTTPPRLTSSRDWALRVFFTLVLSIWTSSSSFRPSSGFFSTLNLDFEEILGMFERWKHANFLWLNPVIKVDGFLPAELIILYSSSSMVFLQPAQQKEQNNAVEVGLNVNKEQILVSARLLYYWSRLRAA